MEKVRRLGTSPVAYPTLNHEGRGHAAPAPMDEAAWNLPTLIVARSRTRYAYSRGVIVKA